MLLNTPKMTYDQQIVFESITTLIDKRTSSFLRSYNIKDYMISLTGAAGTGKTFLTVQIIKHLIKSYSEDNDSSSLKKESISVTAPTHKAVSVIASMLKEQKIQVSCKTIHSFLGIKPFRDYEKGIETFKVDKTKKTKESTTVLIVDESSMIGSELFEYIQEAIEDGRVKVVLFIGDPYQLLPINKKENLIYKLPQSFSLTEVVRQAKDSQIIKIATLLREKIKSKNFIPLQDIFYTFDSKEIELFYNEKEFISDFYKNDKWYDEDKIIATHKNKDVEALNRQIRQKYWQQQGAVNPPALLSGDHLRFNNAYSSNDVTIYSNGQVVTIQNAELKYHESLEIYFWECNANGPIFRVVDPQSMKVFNDKLSYIAKLARHAKYPERRQLWKTFYEVRDMFADVQYIYASTIHKLQGSTYDISYVNLFSLAKNKYISDEEKYRLAYVAITRARETVKVFIPKKDMTPQCDSIDTQKNFNAIDDMLKNFYF